MHLELTDEQTEALIRELSKIIDGDRYPLSPCIVVLKEILGILRPEPLREPLPRHPCGIPSYGAPASSSAMCVASAQVPGA
jgi:hypothetical protein